MPKQTSEFPPLPFAGFKKPAFDFFRELAENQNKAWMTENRQRYEDQIKSPLKSLVVDLTAKMAKLKLPLRGDPEKSLFRINRDVRFSNNKAPYNTHASAVLSRDGTKQSSGVLYIHVEHRQNMVAAGFYMPEPELLHKLRTRIARHPDQWKKVEGALEKAGLALSKDSKLVRMPKGFEPAPPEIGEALKLKSFAVTKSFSDSAMAEAALVDDIAAFAKAAAPLLTFGWQA